jgi:hypothetical protein
LGFYLLKDTIAFFLNFFIAGIRLLAGEVFTARGDGDGDGY